MQTHVQPSLMLLAVVSNSYFLQDKAYSPAEAKTTVFNGIFLSITQTFEPFWECPFNSDDPNCRKVVTYLLDIASSICVLPPEDVPLPQLDTRLVEAFGILCASDPGLFLGRYPEMGEAALRALLGSMPSDELNRASNMLGLDVSMCENRADVIQSVLDSEKPMDDGKDSFTLPARCFSPCHRVAIVICVTDSFSADGDMLLFMNDCALHISFVSRSDLS